MKPLSAIQKCVIQLRLGILRTSMGKGRCWVCGSTSGVKSGRAAYNTRCKRCIKLGRTNAAVETYESLKKKLKGLAA